MDYLGAIWQTIMGEASIDGSAQCTNVPEASLRRRRICLFICNVYLGKIIEIAGSGQSTTIVL